MSDVRKAESGDMENVKQKFLQSHLLQRDHQGFVKDVEVRLIDRTQASNPTKREFYWMRTLRTFPVGTRPKMNVFCTFKIGPFVALKKGLLLDVF